MCDESIHSQTLSQLQDPRPQPTNSEFSKQLNF